MFQKHLNRTKTMLKAIFILSIIVNIVAGVQIDRSSQNHQYRLLQAPSRQTILLGQLKKVYQENNQLFTSWKKENQYVLNPLIQLFNNLEKVIQEKLANQDPSIKQKFNQVHKFSHTKQAQFKNLQEQINQLQRIKDYRIHLHEVYVSRFEPICLPRVKLSTQKKIMIPGSQQLSKYIKNKDLIIVTPNGQKRNLEILFKYLQKQKQSFHKWHLWVDTYTVKQENILFMEKLQRENNWIKVKRLQKLERQSWKNMKNFWFKDCQPNKIYLRIEDDTVWLSENFVSKMFEARIKYPDHILIYANILNNGIIDHINQHTGMFNFYQIAHHHCQGTGWSTVQIVKDIHNQILDIIEKNATSKWNKSLQKWLALSYQQISMNSVIYFSNTIISVQDNYENRDQQQLFSVDLPFTYQKHNLVFGEAFCVNYVDEYQKQFMDKEHPQIIERYRRIAGVD